MARLNGDDFRDWVEAFKDAFDDFGTFRTLVQVASGGKTLDMVAGTGPLEEVIPVVIRKADSGGWLRGLLAQALAMQGDRQLLRNLQINLEVMTIIEPDSAVDATRILGDPMFDRSDLRTKLRLLRSDGATPVLLICGERYSGKTWSARLISHVASRAGDVKFVLVDMEPYIGKPVDAALIGRLIAEEGFPSKPPSPNEEQDAQWGRQYYTWLAQNAKQAGGTCWIVIDHLEKVALSQSAKEFLCSLGRSIPLKMPMVRLVILSYHKPNELEAGVGRVECERVSILGIDLIKKELATFFATELLSRQHAAGVATPDLAALQPKVAGSTDEVLKKWAADDPRRLVKMAEALREELKRITS